MILVSLVIDHRDSWTLVHGVVIGDSGSSYTIFMAFNNDLKLIKFTCSCEYFVFKAKLCKHINFVLKTFINNMISGKYASSTHIQRTKSAVHAV